MSAAGRPLLPWAHRSGAYALPTSLLVRLRLGEVPERIPAVMDVRRGARAAAPASGHGALDRVAATFGTAIRISRLHAAARALRTVGERHRGYSEDEEVSGVARMLRIDVEPGTHVGSLALSLMQLDLVESAIPNYVTTVGLDAPPMPAPRDEDDPDGWAARDLVNARRALAYSSGRGDVVVGVVDSGLALGHPEFGQRLRRGVDTVELGRGDLAGGIRLLGDNAGADTDPSDRFVGHGTGCAAIIAGDGLDIPPGLGGGCTLIPVRSLGAALFPGRSNAVGVGALSDLDMGLVLAVQLGAKIVNCSFGTDDEALEPGAPKPHSEAVAFAEARGTTLVVASGNSGDARTYWPAADPRVIAVGSVGLDRQVSPFSTSGEHVALCAPGERIRTAGLGESYQHATGTSFAAPFVSGAAALLVERAQARAAALDPAQIKALLIGSATPHRAGTPGGNGSGVLDAARALELLDAAIDADDTTDLGGADDG
ncbi:S8 family peptidase [Erythrobacter sp. NE805]|uniref:S8 family peptidase n=1 Tax=Erythrobacter sp. NE805 TaxID=3389875 RepID=UPI00396B38F3